MELVKCAQQPYDRLVKELEQVLVLAKSGELKSFVGCGHQNGGMMTYMNCYPENTDMAFILGALEIVKKEILDNIKHEDISD